MAGAARLGDKAQISLDAHGCPACPHPGVGPAIAGSPDVNVNKRPAIRLDDPGIHMACCGPNTWKAMQGSMTVFVNGKPAVRIGDKTRHCGGLGSIIEGSPNVVVGGPPGMGSSGGSGGAGGGGGGGGPGGGGGGAGSAGGAAARSGGGQRGGGGGGGGSGGGSASGQSSRAGASSGSAGASSPGPAASAAQSPKDDPDVYVVAVDLKTPGGQPLGFEQVVLVKKGTDEQVAGPLTTDASGHVAFVVDKPGEYDVKIIEDERAHSSDQIDESEVTFQLHCRFVDDGVPVEGESVTVSGPDGVQSIALSAAGEIAIAATAGEYELTIRKQTFKAHAVRAADFGGYHEFQLDNELDRTADFERARANRYSPANRGER